MVYRWLTKAEQLNQVATYLYLPYQFLQITGYRLAGKQCTYQWRQYRPEPIGLTNRAQHFVALLFPTVICCLILALQLVLAFYIFAWYYTPQAPWLILIVLIQPLPFSLYGSLMIFDFLRLRRLLRGSSEPARTN